MNKAMRLLQLADKLRTGRKYTVRELADTFQVSYRTMLRDLQEVAELGVPLYSETGVHGGYQMLNRQHKASGTSDADDRSFCRIMDVPAFHAVGFEFVMPLPSNGEAQLLISRLWMELERRIGDIPCIVDRNKRTSIIIHRADEAIVYVCCEVAQRTDIPEDLIGLSVPARSYVIYTHRGSMDKANRLRTGERATAWMTSANITIDPTLSVEWYDNDRFDPHSPANEFHYLRVIDAPGSRPACEDVTRWRPLDTRVPQA